MDVSLPLQILSHDLIRSGPNQIQHYHVRFEGSTREIRGYHVPTIVLLKELASSTIGLMPHGSIPQIWLRARLLYCLSHDDACEDAPPRKGDSALVPWSDPKDVGVTLLDGFDVAHSWA